MNATNPTFPGSHSYNSYMMSASVGAGIIIPTINPEAQTPPAPPSFPDRHAYNASLMGSCTGGSVFIPKKKPGDSNKLSADLKEIFFAAVSGGIAGIVCYPFEGLKKRVQSGQTLVFHPRELFRGCSSFSTSVMLATTGSALFSRAVKYYAPPSLVGEDSLALVSGMFGALVGSTPVENTILTQQLRKTGPVDALKIMFRQGITRPWVGLRETAMREAIFAYVRIHGINKAESAVTEKTNSKTLGLFAAIGVGILGATASQPFDVVATRRQFCDGKISITTAVQQIWQKEGAAGFFKGLNHRVFLFTGCALIIPKIHRALDDLS